MLLSVSEAEKIILGNLATLPVEDCPLTLAHGRVLRSPIIADRDLPPFDRAMLDGIAVAGDSLLAGQRIFKIEGIQAAGMSQKKLSDPANACFEIMTGATLPEGTDTVIPSEELILDAGVARLREDSVALQQGRGVHRCGSDATAGAIVVPTGTRLSAREISIAASVGCGSLRVSMSPRVAVVATGDELVDVNEPVGPHQIRRSNDYGLRALFLSAGCQSVERFHLRDVESEIENTLRKLLAEYDWLVLCGGVSKGKYDFVPQVLERLGVLRLFHGVAQRPGKPLWYGLTQRRSVVFGLPGNPVSALVCAHRYVLPALMRASEAVLPAPRFALLAQPVHFPARLAYFLPVNLECSADAKLRAHPNPFNTSGDFSGLAGTDGFIELPADDREDFPADFPVRFWPWQGA